MAEKSAAQINAAVMRIAGVSKKVFEDKSAPRSDGDDYLHAPSPLTAANAVMEGEKVNQGVYRMEMPKGHDMPPKQAKEKQPGAPEPDDDEDEIKGAHPGEKGAKTEARRSIGAPAKPQVKQCFHCGSPLAADEKKKKDERGRPACSACADNTVVKESNMTAFERATGCPLMEWKRLAGLDEGETGQVPTSGVNKQNKPSKGGGLPGLEGQSIQPIDPVEGPQGKEYVGDAEEVTFDDAIAMLKKENIDINDLWAEFLENRGLSVELFNELIDEADKGGDVEEMDHLLAVEGIFRQELPNLVPENLKESIRPFVEAAYQYPTAQVSAAAAAAAEKIKRHGAEKVRAFSQMGLDPDNDEHQAIYAKRMAMRSGGPPKPRVMGLPGRVPPAKPEGADEESWEFEADGDETGEPSMPWMAAEATMKRLAGRYIAEGKAPKLGMGARFAKLVGKLKNKPGIKDPKAVAAAVGRKKLGAKKMAQLAAKGRRQG